jgi:Na+-translocating ferredoxin:NAD+ oxidoreductase subunit D
MRAERRDFAPAPAPHLPSQGGSVSRIMGEVLLALLPLIAVQIWFGGAGVVIQIALAAVLFWLVEALCLKWRGAQAAGFLRDLSAPLAGVLFALCLPPWAPWYFTAIGAIAAIALAKHAFGGLGYNPFNPAMVGYTVVLVSFTAALARYPGGSETLGFSEALQAVFAGAAPSYDAISGATPLDQLDQAQRAQTTLTELRADSRWSPFASHAATIAALLGGFWLVWRRIAAWQVPFGVLLGVLAVAGPLWLWSPDTNPSPLLHISIGALVFGAFFIATDPVSGAATPRGRLAFGFGVGALTILIRQYGAYPDGVAFAVLLMNATAPLIDRVLAPQPIGR